MNYLWNGGLPLDQLLLVKIFWREIVASCQSVFAVFDFRRKKKFTSR